MSNAAVKAGASPLDRNWAMESLPCTKPGMNGWPHRVLDLSKTISSDGSSLRQLSVLDCGCSNHVGQLIEDPGATIHAVSCRAAIPSPSWAPTDWRPHSQLRWTW